jgi:hypothetical protein
MEAIIITTIVLVTMYAAIVLCTYTDVTTDEDFLNNN